VETVIDGVILQLGDIAGDIDNRHPSECRQSAGPFRAPVATG
jgi:hypothetical protein